MQVAGARGDQGSAAGGVRPPPLEEIVVTSFAPHATALDQRVLLRELNHRIDSGLASAIGLISAEAGRAEGAEAKDALSGVIELLQGSADLHRALRMPRGDALIDAASFIRKI